MKACPLADEADRCVAPFLSSLSSPRQQSQCHFGRQAWVVAAPATSCARIAKSSGLRLLLNTRERARDIAILKALGMTPGQVVAMVTASACVLGAVGGLLGIPAGTALYDFLVQEMSRLAGFTLDTSTFRVAFNQPLLAGVALASILVAMVGAILPARCAARATVMGVLNIE